MILTSNGCRIFHVVVSSFFVLSLFGASVSAQTAAEKIFPDSTKGFIVIRNLEELNTQWQKTQIGALMSDPIMEAFKKDFQAQMAKRMEDRFGFTMDGIEKLPSGEVAAGMIAIPEQMPGYVFTMDIKDRRKETDDYLERLTAKLTSSGTKKEVEKYNESEIIIFTFPKQYEAKRSTLPVKNVPQKTSKTAAKPKETAGEAPTPERQAFYLIKNDHLIVSDQVHLIKLMVDRMDAPEKKSLADVEDFKIVMQRCLKDSAGQSDPLIRWYIEPLNYGESIRILMRGPIAEKRRNKPSLFTILKQQGFDAVRGIGGVVSVKAEEKEAIYRIFAYTKKPYRLAMRMFVFPESTAFDTANWMPADLARCTTAYVDPIAIFDNLGSLFDALVMQGDTGVWDDIVKGLKEDENGPQIDLREEIIVNLGQRVTSFSKYLTPITTQSECIVIAVELKPGKEKAMADALKKLLENDPEMEGTKYGESILWHRMQVEDTIKPFSGPTGAPEIGALPTARPAQPTNVAEEPDPVFPSGAVTVAKGHLFVGTRREYLVTILDRLNADPATAIGQAAEYKDVDAVFGSLGIKGKPHFLQFFARTDETVRPTYEMLRKGTLPQSQAVLSKLLNALIMPDDKENRASRVQTLDGKSLPEFDKVQKYFGPAGIYAVSEDEGLFFKGFLLEKKSESAQEPKKEEPKKEEPKKEEPKKEEPKKEEPKKEEPKKEDEKK